MIQSPSASQIEDKLILSEIASGGPMDLSQKLQALPSFVAEG